MLRAASLLIALAASAAAQWDSVPYAPGAPLFREGFLVATESAEGVRAFSAHTGSWGTVSPPGGTIRAAGDWLVLIEEPLGWRAWSARRNDSDLLQNVMIGAFYVGDDVCLVLDVTDPVAPTAWAYSAQRGEWEDLVLPGQPGFDDVVVSRFVLGVRYEAEYFAFGARVGQWTSFQALDVGANPIADGNTLLVDQANLAQPQLPKRVAAFSGVHNTWSESPDYLPSTGVELAHNVAAVLAAVPGGVAPAAYSAYTGAWSTSGNVYAPEHASLDVADNWVRFANAGPVGDRFEAFGASPGNGWATLAGPYQEVDDDADDVCLVEAVDGSELVAFSGLEGAEWDVLATPGGHSLTLGTNSLALAQHGASTLSAFSPATGAWASYDPGFPAFPFAADGVVGFLVGTIVPMTCWSSRLGTWVVGPQGTAGAAASKASGDVWVAQAQSGPDLHEVTVYDELLGTFRQVQPGFPASLVVGEDHALLVPTGGGTEVWGWSAPRGDWSVAQPSFPLSAQHPPEAHGSVASFVDGADALWAFGAANAGHVWHSWPHDSEWHVSNGAPGGGAPEVVYGVRAQENQVVVGLVSPGQAMIDASIWGVGGTLWLPLSPLVDLGTIGVAGPEGVVSVHFPLPQQLQRGVEVYWQPFVLDVTTGTAEFPDRLDASWFF